MPDLFSFGILTVATTLGLSPRPDWGGHPSNASVPTYVHSLYNITHSLVIFAAIFAVVWMVRRKPFLPMLAWGLHILFDIPTHSTDFFPTPFLWPFSSFKVNGVPWSHPIIFFPEIILLAIFYIWFFGIKKGWKK
ncbi:MAG: hypothetical protein NT034_02775 [Candidatus Magasanikbacteria bacterium]|nr:hypothetical protein [Candidatus Magasanikbacteria bacterium]